MTGHQLRLLPGVGRGVRTVMRGVGHVLVEVGWWPVKAWRLVCWAPRTVLAWVTAAGFAVWADLWTLFAGAAALPVVVGLWARLGPVSFDRRIAHPSWRRKTRRRVRRSWGQLMESCGLGRRVPNPAGGFLTRVPALHRLRWAEPDVLVVVPQLMIGQTVESMVTASERLRVWVGSRQVRVIPNDTHTGCTLRFLFADPLAAVVEARFPSPNLAPNITTAEMGVTEIGDRWLLPVQVHTLTAGSSGSGKASAMWMLLLNLAPAIKSGLVQVHGIDLKGGVEHALGARLFTRRATTLDQAVNLLEDAVTAMIARAETIAGHTRSHTPTPAAPLVIIVIDELAMLTAYSTDRDLVKRADAALRSLLALGRASGFIVYGYLQDPRKDTVPQRHLFNQSYALRLREREEVVMVLSEGAVAAGALCHKIPRSSPGIGYVLTEGGDTMRVRIAHVPDDMIRALAVHFPAPTQIPVVVPAPAEINSSRPSRSRKTTGASTRESRPS